MRPRGLSLLRFRPCFLIPMRRPSGCATPSSARTCMLLTTISGPRPVAYASDAATRDARRAPGSVMSGQPAHRASQAPVNVVKSVDKQVATVERYKRGDGPKEHGTHLKV